MVPLDSAGVMVTPFVGFGEQEIVQEKIKNYSDLDGIGHDGTNHDGTKKNKLC